MKTNIYINENLNIKGEDKRQRAFVAPKKIMRVYGNVNGADILVGTASSQASIVDTTPPCIMKNENDKEHAAILVDFGAEIHGTVRILTQLTFGKNRERAPHLKARVRFGESISEAITPVGTHGATNDHAIRDTLIDVPYFAAFELSETGFRYFYLELMDDECELELMSLTGVLIYRDLEYIGSFESSDSLLNRIWHTAAYTTHLNMQDYLWDGIKRDRIVWIGDMNTEVETSLRVFGDTDVLRRSLEYAVDTTPLPKWMNNITTYSFWWLINVNALYLYTGDVEFIKKHDEYIYGLTKQILSIVDDGGVVDTTVGRSLLDWSTRHDEHLTYVGTAALLALTLKKIAPMLSALGHEELISECEGVYERIKLSGLTPTTHKVPSSLLSLAGLADAKTIDEEIIEKEGVRGYTTFMGYSILLAKALAGNISGGIQAIRDYWGAMVKLGATTFFEDFDIDWVENSTGIDEFPTEGKTDIHRDFGKYCYTGLRHSLCHGWASGPCPWLSEHVLGFKIGAPGMTKLIIEPNLADLEFARGSLPTPFGPVYAEHRKSENGEILTSVSAPKEIELVFKSCRRV